MNRNHLLSDIVYYAIMVIFIIIIVASGYCILKMFNPSVCFGNCAESITAITALVALVVACEEYFTRKDAIQAQVLSEYNKRYSDDPVLIKVAKYLNYIAKDGTINNPRREQPSNYDIEMYMRFIEELEVQIESHRLKEEDVLSLFVYYAWSLSNNKALLKLLGVTDYDDPLCDNWRSFKRIVKRYDYYIKGIHYD